MASQVMTTCCNGLVPEIVDYIDLVRSGRFPVCEAQFLLCDYVEQCFATEDIYVDTELLQKYLSLQKYFPFALYEWELFCFTLHNCTYTSAGSPRWPDLFIMGGRGLGKNGYLAFEDFCLISEYNAVREYDIDICANSEEQAKTSFMDVWKVLEHNKAKLRKHFVWNREVITCIKTGSSLRYRTSNAKTKDGGRQGKVDFDEEHAYENYDDKKVFITGLGKKPHARTTTVTTNGDVRGGPLDDDVAEGLRILHEGDDNGMLPFICRLDSVEEMDNPANWSKANPSLPFNDTLYQQMLKEYKQYKRNPVGNSSFVSKRMNITKGNTDIEVTSWDNILATNKPIPDLAGHSCVAGIDYAKTTDFVTAGMLFRVKGVYLWLSHTWVCSQCPDLERIKPPLRDWEQAGLLTFVDAPEVSPDIPAAWLMGQARQYDIRTLCIDLYRYTLLAKSLKQHGFDTDKGGYNNIKLIRKSSQMLIAPTIASAFSTHCVVWGDSPLMRWFVNNTCVKTTGDGNMAYEKIEPKSRKTDGFMAFVAAMCGSDVLEDCELFDDMDLDVYIY